MYKTDVTIYCAMCGKAKQKLKTEYDRRTRHGQKDFYCSRSCSSKHVYILGHLKNATDGKEYITRQIILARDESGQFMPYQWVRDRLNSFNPCKAMFSMPSEYIDVMREQWSKETIKPIKSTTEELQPIPDENPPSTTADEIHDASSVETQHSSIDAIIEGQTEIGENNEPSEDDEYNNREYVDFCDCMEW